GLPRAAPSLMPRPAPAESSRMPQPARTAPRTMPQRARTPILLPLCRNNAQLEAVIAAGLSEVELDWMERTGLARAAERARAAGLRCTLATLRVQKPGEENLDEHLVGLRPDGVLVRHWGGMVRFARLAAAGAGAGPRLHVHGDFSLNVTNSVTAR